MHGYKKAIKGKASGYFVFSIKVDTHEKTCPCSLKGTGFETCCTESTMCIVFVIYSLVPRTVHTRLQTQLEQTSLGKLVGTKFWSPRLDFQMKMGSSA